MKIKLSRLVEAIYMLSDDAGGYYSPSKEDLVYPYIDGYSEEESEEMMAEEGLIPLPDKYDRDDYGNMKRFIAEKTSGEAKEWLTNAIRGRGAFRMFRATVERFGLLEEWYDYQEKCYLGLALEWCSEHGIEYDDSDYNYSNAAKDEEEEEDPEDTSDFVHFTPVKEEKADITPVTKVEEKPEKKRDITYTLTQLRKDTVNRAVYMAADFADMMNHTKDQDIERAEERLSALVENGGILVCMEDHGRGIGYACAEKKDDGYCITEAYVREEYRKKGIGEDLVKSLEEIADQKTGAKLYLGNTKAAAFASKMGYGKVTAVELGKGEAADSFEIDGVRFQY